MGANSFRDPGRAFDVDADAENNGQSSRRRSVRHTGRLSGDVGDRGSRGGSKLLDREVLHRLGRRFLSKSFGSLHAGEPCRGLGNDTGDLAGCDPTTGAKRRIRNPPPRTAITHSDNIDQLFDGGGAREIHSLRRGRRRCGRSAIPVRPCRFPGGGTRPVTTVSLDQFGAVAFGRGDR